MTTTHTPGPWEAADLRVMWGSYFVADCNGKGDIGRQDESRANARLIAAAPDLLAALQLIVNGCTRVVDQDSCGQDMVKVRAAAIEKGRAAIAKAGGAA